MFTNLILHLCQSDCLCSCQMYLFSGFYVKYGGDYKRYPPLFDLRSYSTSVSMSITMAIFLMFAQGKVLTTLLLHTRLLIDQIVTFSLQPGSGGIPFPDILYDCCSSWAQHNFGNSTSNVEQTPSSVV